MDITQQEPVQQEPVAAPVTSSHKKLIGIIVAVLLLGGIGAYAYTSGWTSFKEAEVVDVIESMVEVESARYEMSFQASIQSSPQPSPIVVKGTFKGILNTKDLENIQSSVDGDISITGVEYVSTEPIQIGFELRTIGKTSYAKLKSISGLTGLGLQISQSKWIRINETDLQELYNLGGADISTPEVNAEALERIQDTYGPQFSALAKKHDLISILSVKNSERIDGEGTRTTSFRLQEDATIAFSKEALPLYFALIKDVIKTMPQYKDMMEDEAFTISDEDYRAIEEGLREFFKSTDTTFSATIGKRTAHLYSLIMDMKIHDEMSGGEGTVTATMMLRDFDKDLSVEVPTDVIPLREFMESLMGGEPGGQDFPVTR
ncbi:MAG: hypothetical protein AAB420_01840 [Patescibacteria group bacterium]